MELAKLISKIRKRIVWVIMVSFVFAVGSGFVVKKVSPHYVSSLTFYVQKTPEQGISGEYRYDGYYAQQLAEAYTDTVVGLIESPDTLSKALTKLQKDVSKELEAYSGAVRVEKTAPQLVILEVALKEKEEATLLIETLAQVSKDQVDDFNKGYDQRIELQLINPIPLIRYQEISAVLAGGIGFAFSLVIGIGVIFLFEYLKENE